MSYETKYFWGLCTRGWEGIIVSFTKVDSYLYEFGYRHWHPETVYIKVIDTMRFHVEQEGLFQFDPYETIPRIWEDILYSIVSNEL